MKEHEAGLAVAELCRKARDVVRDVYSWKAKFGGPGSVTLCGYRHDRRRQQRHPEQAAQIGPVDLLGRGKLGDAGALAALQQVLPRCARASAFTSALLRKHYCDELDTGYIVANAKVAESHFRKATGDHRLVGYRGNLLAEGARRLAGAVSAAGGGRRCGPDRHRTDRGEPESSLNWVEDSRSCPK